MRGLLLAVAMAGAPALASAQTTGGASGTLLDEPTLATTTTTEAPAAQPAAETPAPDAPAQPPASSVAAPGINLSDTGASNAGAPAPTATPHHHATATATPPSDSAPASGVAAPGVNVNGATHHAAAPRAAIEPANALERAFIGAAHEQSERAAFRHTFLDSQVALATVSDAAGAAPRLVTLGPAGDACLIFTSDARATQIMGPNSPRQMMTGREALQRLRGAHLVIININMDPYLTLDAAGVDAFLGADSAPAQTSRSAGPAQ